MTAKEISDEADAARKLASPVSRLHGLVSGRLANAALVAGAVAMASLPSLVTKAESASGNVHFGANVDESNVCAIIVNRDGDFGVSADKKVMSSKLPGGMSGIAEVHSGRNYFISAGTYDFFTSSPSGGSDDTVFEPRFSGEDILRGRTFAERPGSSAVRLRGNFSITRLNLHLTATRSGSSFPSGGYVGTVVVRCE
jgi:hypothetical protein